MDTSPRGKRSFFLSFQKGILSSSWSTFFPQMASIKQLPLERTLTTKSFHFSWSELPLKRRFQLKHSLFEMFPFIVNPGPAEPEYDLPLKTV